VEATRFPLLAVVCQISNSIWLCHPRMQDPVYRAEDFPGVRISATATEYSRLPRFPPFQAERPAQASILAAQAPGQRTPLTERTSSQRQDLGLLVFFFSLCRVHRQASALCPICFSLDFCCRSIRSSIQLPPSPAPQFGFLHEERTRVSFC
jgi:hypothetical protein